VLRRVPKPSKEGGGARRGGAADLSGADDLLEGVARVLELVQELGVVHLPPPRRHGGHGDGPAREAKTCGEESAAWGRGGAGETEVRCRFARGCGSGDEPTVPSASLSRWRRRSTRSRS
jgi:hypothetical protein